MRLQLLLALLATCFLAAPGRAQDADQLIGIWGTQLRLGPTLRGRLTIKRGNPDWTALIAGRRTSFVQRGQTVRFDFGKDGGFRGELQRGAIRGFWIQPASDRLQSYATPLLLAPAGRTGWRANVVPVAEKFTLWLKIFRSDGVIVAAFRNPESNSIGGASQFQLTRTGKALKFAAKSDRGEIDRNAELLGTPERIRLQWPDLGRTVELARLTPSQARAFFPRPPGDRPYNYAPPKELHDGWQTARAADVGIDESALTLLVQSIAASDPASRRPSLIHSLLIARGGKLVLEEYFFGFDADMPHDIRSAGKTFASVLTGAEMRRGVPIGPDSRVYDLLAPMGPFANPDPRKTRITLSNLMTHSTGLACDDNDDSSPGNESTMQRQTKQANWWKYTLDLAQLHDPGTRYAYCSATMNLVGAALTTASRTWLPAMFERDVAEPLQFGRWSWNLMPNGEGYAGGGTYLRPRDLLKVGQAYLDGGIWNARPIVTADWVRASTTPRIEITPATTGMSEEEFGNAYIRGADGLAWHGVTVTSGGRTYRGYSAGGNGGQLLLVFPELDLTAVLTGGNYGQGGIWLRWPQQIIGDQVIPAVRQPN